MFSFIIPVKNDAKRLQHCLTSIAACRPTADYEVIVVDNGSTDDSATVGRGAGARVLPIAQGRVSALRNAAVAAAGGEWLAFVDADHELGQTWISAASDVARTADIGAAGALYLPPADGTWVQNLYGALRGRTIGRGDTRWLGSGNLLVRREAFEAVGGFDPNLESCEDVDLCQRLRDAGWRLVGDERLVSIHHGDPKTLARLFHAERWRGRDNLRVTFRTRLRARDLPSIIAPIVIALAVPASVLAAVLAPVTHGRSIGVAVASASLVVALIMVRTVKIATAGRVWQPVSLTRALAVAATYELARAAALVTRAAHHRETSVTDPRPSSAPAR